MPEPVHISDAIAALLDDLDPAPSYRGPIQRTLRHHMAGAWCATCRRGINHIGAIGWAIEHAAQNGHVVLVDYRARYAVSRPRRAP